MSADTATIPPHWSDEHFAAGDEAAVTASFVGSQEFKAAVRAAVATFREAQRDAAASADRSDDPPERHARLAFWEALTGGINQHG